MPPGVPRLLMFIHFSWVLESFQSSLIFISLLPAPKWSSAWKNASHTICYMINLTYARCTTYVTYVLLHATSTSFSHIIQRFVCVPPYLRSWTDFHTTDSTTSTLSYVGSFIFWATRERRWGDRGADPLQSINGWGSSAHGVCVVGFIPAKP